MRRFTYYSVIGSLVVGGFAQAATGAEKPPHYAWLLRQRNTNTGLVQSFETFDRALRHQAATYDQALAGMAFLLMDDAPSAKRMLRFYQSKWRSQGFPNFYHAQTGLPGIEATIHVGPNAWIGLLALAYERQTGDARFWRLAESIAVWIASLHHHQGAVAMGPQPDWGADWTRVYSSENNLSYMALLDGLLAMHANDSAHAKLFASERAGILRFLETVTFRDVDRCQINTGYNQQGIDRIQAFDVIPLAVMIVGPQQLQMMGVDAMHLVRCGERRFSAQDLTVRGFDFTDAAGAEAAHRGRMVSVEWTAMMIRAYRSLADEAGASSHVVGQEAAHAHARQLLLRAQRFQQELDRLSIRPATQEQCYPYATQMRARVFPHSPWWRTPAGGPGGLACSVAGTIWRYFAEHWDPFTLARTRATIFHLDSSPN